jgi:hypothetical protein
MVKNVTITERLLASQKRTTIYGIRAQLRCDDIRTEDSFPVWAERASPYSLTADTRGRRLLAALDWLVTGLLTLCPVSLSLPHLREGFCRHTIIELYQARRIIRYSL